LENTIHLTYRLTDAFALGQFFLDLNKSLGCHRNVKPRQVRVQSMARKWASCSSDGRVTFSEDLLGEPGSFQDYVIVHELLHLKVPNHGKLFKSLLSAHIPGWRRVVLSCCDRHL
jgi:predicted metal-dependent hydrolase